MYIIAGLGNPGSKYENTRHNMGFKAIDAMASEFGIDVNRAKFKGLIGEGRIGSEKVILLKPQTYMNLSGQSVREIMNFYKIPEENLIVIYDDFDLPIGSIRVRKSGGPGTHNGMKSVVQEFRFRHFRKKKIFIFSMKPEIRTNWCGESAAWSHWRELPTMWLSCRFPPCFRRWMKKRIF